MSLYAPLTNFLGLFQVGSLGSLFHTDPRLGSFKMVLPVAMSLFNSLARRLVWSTGSLVFLMSVLEVAWRSRQSRAMPSSAIGGGIVGLRRGISGHNAAILSKPI